MPEPRIRTVSKATAPYGLNDFPQRFVEKFAAEVVYMHATKSPISIEGKEWEQIFAHCVGADWAPSNCGLDDVVLGNCCWSAKTVKSSSRDLSRVKAVRLIVGRNSPTYSYGEAKITPSNGDPNKLGAMVLGIWNERVSGIRAVFKFARTVVLVKSDAHDEFLIFEKDTTRYDPELYHFTWNANGNLEGYENETQKHRFTWQPSGSQFTVIEDVPSERVHLKVRIPGRVNKETILKAVGFDEPSYWVMRLD